MTTQQPAPLSNMANADPYRSPGSNRMPMPGLPQTFWRAKWRILAISLLGGLLMALIGLSRPVLYEAKSQLLVAAPTQSNQPNGTVVNSETANEIIDGNLTLLSSNSHLRRVAEALDKEGDQELLTELRAEGRPNFAVAAVSRTLRAIQSKIRRWFNVADTEALTSDEEAEEELITALKNNLRVGQELRSRVISVGYTSKNRLHAAHIANLVAQTYVDHLLSDNKATAEEDFKEIEQRVPVVRDGLQAQIEKRQNFFLASPNGGKSEPGSESLELSQLKQVLARVNADLESVKSEQDRDYLKREAASLQQRISAIELTGSEAAKHVSELRIMDQEIEVSSKQLNDVLQRREVLKLRIASPASSVSFLSPAYPPRDSKTLSPIVLIPPGMILFGLGTLAALVLRRLLDTTLRSEEQSEFLLAVPSAGLMPRWPRSSAQNLVTELIDKPQSVRRRATAAILTAIATRSDQTGCKLIAVTSSNSSEAKTELAWCLALVAGDIGYRVVFHDLDVNEHEMTRSLRNSPELNRIGLGFAELSVDNIYAKSSASRSVAFVPTANSRRHATQLYSGAGMLETMSERYNRNTLVILNVPSLSESPEACLITDQADAVVLAVGWGTTKRQVISSAVKLLTRNRMDRDSVVTVLTNASLRRQTAAGDDDVGHLLQTQV